MSARAGRGRSLLMRWDALWATLASWSVVAFVFLFLFAPIIVVCGASFSGGALDAIDFPPRSLSLERYAAIPASQYQSMWLSLQLAVLAAAIAVLIGVPAALGIVRSRVPGKAVIAAIFRAPIQIPAVVVGITFLQFSYTLDDALHLDFAGSFGALLLAHCFIATPYVIGTLTAVLQRFDRRLEEAASSLGASPWRCFRRVTLPVMMPGLYAGTLYGFMVSFSDVPVSMFLAPAGAGTYPVEIFFGLEQDFDPSILASATLVILFCFALVLLVQRFVGLDALLRTSGGGGR
jgi:putative spermidine/putrescine transport system permease protein